MNFKNYLRLFFITISICAGVIFTVSVPLSCRLTEDGIQIISSENAPPKIVSFSVLNSTKLSILCSEKVSLTGVIVKTKDDMYVSENNTVSYGQEGCLSYIELGEPTLTGTNYVVTGTVHDMSGNSLFFSLPFTGFNENPARLILSEIRTKHSTSGGVLKKGEYVELFVLKGGNTAGLEIVSGSDGESKKYSFPFMEVNEGEYVVVHYRTLAEGLCQDELEGDLKASIAADSSETGRDLWIENTESRISDNDVIVLRDACRETVMDAVLFSATDKTGWYYSGQKALSIEAYESGVWSEGSGVDKAAASDYITLTRSLNRLNLKDLVEKWKNGQIASDSVIEAKKEDWAVCVKATPGTENCTEIYEK